MEERLADLLYSSDYSLGSEDDTQKTIPSQFTVELSNADVAEVSGSSSGSGPPPALPSNPLTPEQVAKLMARAEDGGEELGEEGDEVDFNQREATMPTPKTGERVQLDLFSPPELDDAGPSASQIDPEELARRAKEQAGDVEIIRFYPEGAKATARSKTVTNCALTFNQPMVELGSVDAQDSVIPAVLDPPAPGVWRWTGVTTLQFIPETRFPMATTYTVTVPEGTTSTLGNVLREDFSFSFTTNPVQLVESTPRSSSSSGNVVQTLRPQILAVFDQAVNAEALLELTSLTASGSPYGGTLSVFSGDVDELAKKDEFSWTIRGLRSRDALDRMVVFELDTDLPNNAAIKLSIGAGAFSAEGPNPTTSEISILFQTYPPFSLIEPHSSTDYRPGSTWTLNFTNPVDYTTLRKDMITIEPPLEAWSVQVPEYSTTSIAIINKSQKQTTYTVTIDRELLDKHGQNLSKNSVTIRVGKPYLCGSVSGPDGMVTFPASNMEVAYPVVVYNFNSIRVRLFQVSPSDYIRSPLESTYNYFHKDQESILDIGTCVEDYEVEFDDVEETPLDYMVPIANALQNQSHNTGQLYVVVEPTKAAWSALQAKVRYGNSEYRYRPIAHAWVQVTNIGIEYLTFSANAPELLVWATQLTSGAPLPEAAVTLSEDSLGACGEDGIFQHAFASAGGVRNKTLVVSYENDQAFVPGITVTASPPVSTKWFVFDDRKLYKPNEFISIKGYIRRVTVADSGAISPAYVEGATVTWKAYDSRGNRLMTSEEAAELPVPEGGVEALTTTSAFGGFHFTVPLPDNLNLGTGRVEIEMSAPGLPRSSYTHEFKCEEFRRPEYDVSAKIETPGALVSSLAVSGTAVAAASAQYFAGGGLSGAQSRWKVVATKGSYTPPSWSEYTFGKMDNWWTRSRSWWLPDYVDPDSNPDKLGEWTHSDAYTDADGEHRLAIDFAGNANPPTPITLTASVDVVDVNNQARSAKASKLLHPSRLYVGFKTKAWGLAGEPLAIDTVVVDTDGEVMSGVGIDVEVAHSLTRLVEDEESGVAKWVTTEYLDNLQWSSDGSGAVSQEYVPTHGGSYTFTLTVADADGSLNCSSFTVQVRGKEPKRGATNTRVEVGEVMLIPDKKEYEAGDEAELLIQAPFAPAEVLVTISADGIQSTDRFAMEDSAVVYSYTVAAEWLPNYEVRVDVVGVEPQTNALGLPDLDSLPKPAVASGSMMLKVSKRARTLEAQVVPTHPSLAPGSETSVTVQVTSAETGAPVPNAEVTLIVVDESVLALTGYKLTDPIDTFFVYRSAGPSNDAFSQSTILLLSPEDMERFRSQTQTELADNESSARVVKEKACKMKRCCRSRGAGCSGGGGPPMARCCAAGGMPPMMPCCSMACDNCMCERACMNCCCDACCLECGSDSSSGENSDDDGEDYDCDGEGGAGPEADDDAAELAEGASKVKVRTRFDALAHFTPTNVTDADGNVQVTFEMPDSLTKYRVWAIAATDMEYGKGESQIVAELPLMVRPSMPRFLNFGDSCEIPVVLQNQTDEELKVYLGCRVSNLDLEEGFSGGYVVLLAPRARGALDFPVTTTGVGTGRVQWVAAAGDFSDAITKTVPLFTPATSEATATYGDAAEDGVWAFELRPPTDAIPQFGGAEISLSSTILQGLTDAVVALYNYPHECCEQVASKVLGILPLLDVLESFNVSDLPTTAALTRSLEKDLKLLARRQQGNGGFAYWTGRTDPYVTAHVGHMLAKADERGFEMPRSLIGGTVKYLKNIDSHLREWPYYLYSTKSKNGFRAYAAFALTRLGVDTGSRVAELYGEHVLDDFSMEALGWLLVALARSSQAGEMEETRRAILKHLGTHVNETAQTAFFVSGYGEESGYVMLHSNRRTDAVLLEALLEADPESDLIVKVAKGLLEHRKAGKWRNTQENAFVLVALQLYFTIREAEVPDFTSHMWLGSEYAGSASFAGRTTETQVGNMDMAKLLACAAESEGDREGLARLVIQREGLGRMYYRIGVNYAPANLSVDPMDRGFVVSREYVGVDDPSHAVLGEDGVWRLALGEKIRVRVFMRTTQRRYHVALVDYLPAGLEALNPALKGTPEEKVKHIEDGEGRSGGSSRPRGIFCWRWTDPLRWFEYTNIRDERVEAFKGLLWEGNYEYQYIARATTPGSMFVTPPAKAYCMYEPEVFGRSGTEKVMVVR